MTLPIHVGLAQHILKKGSGARSLTAVNRCCTAPVNVIKIQIKYSCLFRNMEKVENELRVSV